MFRVGTPFPLAYQPMDFKPSQASKSHKDLHITGIVIVTMAVIVVALFLAVSVVGTT